MRNARLEDMNGGWFVGNFLPSALHSTDAEVAVKHYRAGSREPLHLHKVATEVTLVLSGSVRMIGHVWNAGDIIVLDPGESTGFEAIEDSVTVVVKTPSLRGDKYPVASS